MMRRQGDVRRKKNKPKKNMRRAPLAKNNRCFSSIIDAGTGRLMRVILGPKSPCLKLPAAVGKWASRLKKIIAH